MAPTAWPPSLGGENGGEGSNLRIRPLSFSRISGKGAGLRGGTGCALAGDIAKVGLVGS